MVVLGQFALTVAYYCIVVNYKTFLQITATFNVVHAVNLLTVAADGFIALSMVLLLNKTRSGFKRSDTLINKLIIYALNTSLISSICSIGSMTSTYAWPHTFIFFFFFYCAPRSESVD